MSPHVAASQQLECYLSINGTSSARKPTAKKTSGTNERHAASGTNAASPGEVGAACPFCQSRTCRHTHGQRRQHPDRYGLDEKTFARTVTTIKRFCNEAESNDAATPPVAGVSVADRLEHQQNMADMSDLAVLERQTSPTLAPYHVSPNSQLQPQASSTSPVPLSLEGSNGRRLQLEGQTRGYTRLNSIDRQNMQQGHLSELFGPVGERISNSNRDVRMAIEQMMMEEAIRQSLSLDGGSSSSSSSSNDNNSTSGGGGNAASQSVANSVINLIGNAHQPSRSRRSSRSRRWPSRQVVSGSAQRNGNGEAKIESNTPGALGPLRACAG